MRKQQIINLWQNVFNDPPEFVRLFFDRVYKEENALTLQKEGRIVSALQMLPYPMTFEREVIPVSYIYGACTIEPERGKGHMAELLERSFETMKARGIALTVIIPAESWLFNYYDRFGYATCFDFSIESFDRETLPSHSLIQVTIEGPEETEEVDFYLDRKQRQRPCYVLHTKEDWKVNRIDLRASDGRLLVARLGGKICGAAFALPSIEGEVFVQEIFYDGEEAKEALLHKASILFHAEKAICRVPPKAEESTPFGMARIIDRERMIRLWTARHPLDDPAQLHQMDTPSLTQYLLQYPQKKAYMSLMMD